uniref:Uncharacterized protein n=1 Tax=Romanomermis culicivorax TaxID=13658 RepID=A0A915L6H2_ROMCU
MVQWSVQLLAIPTKETDYGRHRKAPESKLEIGDAKFILEDGAYKVMWDALQAKIWEQKCLVQQEFLHQQAMQKHLQDQMTYDDG